MIGFIVCAALAAACIAAAMLFPWRLRLAPEAPPAEPEPVELPVEAPTPTPADLDPKVELADLLARANTIAGGKYLAINVGPSRHERRAEAARARKAVTDRGKAKRARAS